MMGKNVKGSAKDTEWLKRRGDELDEQDTDILPKPRETSEA